MDTVVEKDCGLPYSSKPPLLKFQLDVYNITI